MSTATQVSPQSEFMSLLPELKSRADALMSDTNPDQREEAVQEMLCSGWQNYLSAWNRGKSDKLTPFKMAVYAHQSYKSGRRFCGSKMKDAMSDKARFRGRCRAIGFPDIRPQFRLHQILADPRVQDRPDEQTRVNLDYAMILKQPGISDRARKVWNALLDDNGPGHVKRIAASQEVSEARVSQVKGELARLLAIYGYAPDDLERRRRPGRKKGQKRGSKRSAKMRAREAA